MDDVGAQWLPARSETVLAPLAPTFMAGTHLPLSFGMEATFHGADDLEIEIRYGKYARLEADGVEFRVEDEFVTEYGPVQFAGGDPTRVTVRGSGEIGRAHV